MPESHLSRRYSSAAALRNREPIAEVLGGVLQPTGKILEIASGSGEHALYFAQKFPQHLWQPSDPDPRAVESIAGWAEGADLPNLLPPLQLDATHPESWPDVEGIAAMLCINMIHISPWAATEGLVRGAGARLAAQEPLILYGPFLRGGVETAPSNLAFDADLKRRNSEWGLRSLTAVQQLADGQGFDLDRIVEMPANNLTVIFRKRA